MSKISLKFTHKDGKFCLCAHVKGTQVRHYKVVSVIKNPNFSKWNPQAQMFISKVENDLQNNIRLLDFLSPFEKLLAEQEFTSRNCIVTFVFVGAQLQAVPQRQKRCSVRPFLPRKLHQIINIHPWHYCHFGISDGDADASCLCQNDESAKG